MSEEKKYTESEAQRFFAVQFRGRTWELLDKSTRTQDENERMVDYAHASLAHWRSAGTGVHHQRGEWMLARVYAVLGDGFMAIRHARRCLELLEAHRGEMKDFDFAFAYEAIGRAQAIAGNRSEAKKYIHMAQEAGEAIAEEEDRKVFFADFNGGDWNGMR